MFVDSSRVKVLDCMYVKKDKSQIIKPGSVGYVMPYAYYIQPFIGSIYDSNPKKAPFKVADGGAPYGDINNNGIRIKDSQYDILVSFVYVIFTGYGEKDSRVERQFVINILPLNRSKFDNNNMCNRFPDSDIINNIIGENEKHKELFIRLIHEKFELFAANNRFKKDFSNTCICILVPAYDTKTTDLRESEPDLIAWCRSILLNPILSLYMAGKKHGRIPSHNVVENVIDDYLTNKTGQIPKFSEIIRELDIDNEQLIFHFRKLFNSFMNAYSIDNKQNSLLRLVGFLDSGNGTDTTKFLKHIAPDIWRLFDKRGAEVLNLLNVADQGNKITSYTLAKKVLTSVIKDQEELIYKSTLI